MIVCLNEGNCSLVGRIRAEKGVVVNAVNLVLQAVQPFTSATKDVVFY